MTNYFVNGLQETTATGVNGQNMTGTDSLFVSGTGEIVALGGGALSAIYLNASSTSNNVTIDGEVYCAQGDGIYSQSTGLALTLNGNISSGVNGVDVEGKSSIFVGSAGSINASGTGIIVGGAAAGTYVTVDGAVSSANGLGIDVYSEANITVGKNGDLYGGTNGIDLETGSAGSVLYNRGTIESNHDANNDIYVGDHNIEVDNAGTIAGPVNPVNINGANALIINSGTITGTNGEAFILFGGANATTIHNSGSIVGGLQVDGATGAVFIENSGTWLAPAGIDGTGFDDSLVNSGTIHGPIDMGTGSVTFTNSGQITGAIFFEGGDDQVDNSGLIHGTMIFGTGDSITNGGTIHGAVTLGQSDDFVNSGRVQGTITMGTGDTFDTSTGSVTGSFVATTSDTFDFSGNFGHYKIADFATAGTTHDILSFAADDFSSFTELQSHMAQVGGDVVITLDGNDDIIILHTKLTALASHDFAFT
jgi:hypothetical protein